MDVETVEFVPRKGINGPQDVLFGVPVSGNIQVQTSMVKFRPITDTDWGEIGIHASAIDRVRIEQLCESLESAENTSRRYCRDSCCAIGCNRQVISLINSACEWLECRVAVFCRLGDLEFPYICF